MNLDNSTKNDTRWAIVIPNFSKEKRNQVALLAKESRRAIGDFVGAILEKEIESRKQKN